MGCGSGNRNGAGDDSTRDVGKKPSSWELDSQLKGSKVASGLALAWAEDFMAIVPCRSSIIEPTYHNVVDGKEPEEDYDLEYIYGYKTDDSAMSCYYSSTGKVVYSAGKLGIVLDPKVNTQAFFGGKGTGSDSGIPRDQHTDNITAVAISQNREVVATAQIGRYPSIYLWKAENCTLLVPKSKIILGEKKYLPKGVSAMAFSQNGDYLAIADTNDEHRIYVFTTQTQEEKMVEPSKGGITVIKAIAWSRKPGENVFCTVGKKFVKFWHPFAKEIKKRTVVARLPAGVPVTDFFSAVYDDKGNCYTGTANGHIFVWNPDGTSQIQVAAHQGVIYSLALTSDGKMISGGSDCKVIVHSMPELKKEAEHKFKAHVLSVDYAVSPSRILVALNDSSIIEVQVEQENYFQMLMQGHYDGHLVALDTSEESMVTGGEDNKIIFWNYVDRSAFISSAINKVAEKGRISGSQSRFPDNQRCRALAINRVHGQIAVAVSNGSLQVRESGYMLDHVVFRDQILTDKMLSCLKYSPDGNRLAVAAQDGCVYMYDSKNADKYARLTVINGSSGCYITELDWSSNGGYIRALDTKFYLRFYDTLGNKQTNGALRICEDLDGHNATKGLEWATGSIRITWSTEGIYPKNCAGEHIKCVAVSHNKRLVMTGDATRMVNLYKNPCRPGHKCKSLLGHASIVYNVAFSPDDSRIFSVAGPDRCLMQWVLKKEAMK